MKESLVKSKPWIMKRYQPATTKDLQLVEQELHLVLPTVVQQILRESNGLLGQLVTLYSTEDIVEMNQTYEVQSYAPGYVSIGNDHGGYHLLMKAEQQARQFQLVSDGYGVPEEKDVTDTLTSLLASDDGNPWKNER